MPGEGRMKEQPRERYWTKEQFELEGLGGAFDAKALAHEREKRWHKMAGDGRNSRPSKLYKNGPPQPLGDSRPHLTDWRDASGDPSRKLSHLPLLLPSLGSILPLCPLPALSPICP